MDVYCLEVPVPGGEYYGGVDFGKLEDYSVIAILRREGELLKLVYLYEFSLGTPYSNVIGHLVRANKKFRFRRLFVDQTGVGEPVLEELKAQFHRVYAFVWATSANSPQLEVHLRNQAIPKRRLARCD